MRKLRPRLATAFFVMCIGILTFAQDTPSTSASDSAGAEQQVKQLEQQIRSQVVKGDTSGLEQYLADDYLNVNPAGMVSDKNQTIQMLKTGRVKYGAIDVKDERVRPYGDAVVFNGLATVKLMVDGQDRSGDYRVTIVWAKVGGQWKRVSFQSTRVSSER